MHHLIKIERIKLVNSKSKQQHKTEVIRHQLATDKLKCLWLPVASKHQSRQNQWLKTLAIQEEEEVKNKLHRMMQQVKVKTKGI